MNPILCGRSAGPEFPRRKITVNLAPADIKKEGSSFDLPIAVGLLSATDIIRESDPEGTVFLGELAFDGKLRQVKGVLPIAVEARKNHIKRLIVPAEAAWKIYQK